MNFAPIIIPTLNRLAHLQECIESLRKNKEALQTDLFISVDYPPNEKFFEGYGKVCEYLKKGVDGFNSVNLFFQDTNLGPCGNIDFLVNVVANKYSTYIFSEDDNVFSEDFLTYINAMLNMYEKNDEVIAIAGYFWPITIDEENVFKSVKIDSIFSAWGYATWIKKFNSFCEGINITNFESLFHNRVFLKKLSIINPFIFTEFVKGFIEYSGCLVSEGEVCKIDLAFSIWMFAQGKNQICPSKSKVRNMGNDGSGVNCVESKYKEKEKISFRNYDFSSQNISISDELVYEAGTLRESNIEKKLKVFLSVKKKEVWKSKIVCFLIHILGRKKVKNLLGK